ncbi:hypothetical protein NEOLEDRAFT_1140433 [Neolentinus lepideus HHB14362 ss-1]|uniref:Uncharacterized protein n=1 Tax=Neolentinus lepideus HHB14362 ss-1 TaxID=1314782 RepID=A0A165P9I6_9AGAM|nr:hypothetical protein NEOLEDRAFT_1140433 [Neolentinus lepideus HHB14362 ss-1]
MCVCWSLIVFHYSRGRRNGGRVRLRGCDYVARYLWKVTRNDPCLHEENIRFASGPPETIIGEFEGASDTLL